MNSTYSCWKLLNAIVCVPEKQAHLFAYNIDGYHPIKTICDGPPSPPLPLRRQALCFTYSARSVFRLIWRQPDNDLAISRILSVYALMPTRTTLSPQYSYRDSLDRYRWFATTNENTETSTVSLKVLLQHIDAVKPWTTQSLGASPKFRPREGSKAVGLRLPFFIRRFADFSILAPNL